MLKAFLLGLHILLLFLSACSTQTSYKKPLQRATPSYHTQESIKHKLYKAYKKWQGVSYCYGGEDKNGVDCSSLVQKIYKEAFNIKLPRTTHQQIREGISISKSKLKEGDLLFFKTSYKGLHSAIYLENGYFIHTSSKHGVTISNINNPYWKEHYYKAKRILF